MNGEFGTIVVYSINNILYKIMNHLPCISEKNKVGLLSMLH